jgi:tRNA pseudouridine55 synthase
VIIHALKAEGRASTSSARTDADCGDQTQNTVRAEPVEALPSFPLEEITLTAHVSKGTYIRSLARDIAYALGTVGHVTMLRRVKAGPFTLDKAISLDILEAAAKDRALEDLFLPLRAGLDDIPALSLTPAQAGLLRQGQQVTGIAAPDGQCFAMLDDVPVALAEVQAGLLRVVRGFNL